MTQLTLLPHIQHHEVYEKREQKCRSWTPRLLVAAAVIAALGITLGVLGLMRKLAFLNVRLSKITIGVSSALSLTILFLAYRVWSMGKALHRLAIRAAYLEGIRIEYEPNDLVQPVRLLMQEFCEKACFYKTDRHEEIEVHLETLLLCLQALQRHNSPQVHGELIHAALRERFTQLQDQTPQPPHWRAFSRELEGLIKDFDAVATAYWAIQYVLPNSPTRSDQLLYWLILGDRTLFRLRRGDPGRKTLSMLAEEALVQLQQYSTDIPEQLCDKLVLYCKERQRFLYPPLNDLEERFLGFAEQICQQVEAKVCLEGSALLQSQLNQEFYLFCIGEMRS